MTVVNFCNLRPTVLRTIFRKVTLPTICIIPVDIIRTAGICNIMRRCFCKKETLLVIYSVIYV